jgi:protein-tyrosine-phosphatase
LEGLSGPKPPQAAPARPPLAVLFACGLNSVRSPMAAALFAQMFGRASYVVSAGVRKGELDPFAVAVMAEIGLDISRHKPVTLEELQDWEGLNFDLMVTLAPEAHHRALELTRMSGVDVEYWPTADPSAVEGSRSQRLDAYRQVRDHLLGRIQQRFAMPKSGNE